jgi:gas vesicle protein
MLNLDTDGGQTMRGFSKSETVGFFVAGAAVGAAVALLFAPKTGAQTRKDIRKFSKKTVNQLDDLQSDVRDQISEGYDQMMEVFDNVKEFVEDGRMKLQKMIRTA